MSGRHRRGAAHRAIGIPGALLGALLTAFAAAAPAALPSTTTPAVGRVVVMFKPGAKVLDAMAPPGAGGAARARAEVLSKRTGIALATGAEIAERMQVVKSPGVASDALARRLQEDPDVLFAVPDERVHIRSAPNDPLYAAGARPEGPDAGQWYLRAPAGDIVSSIDAERAWDVTTGSPAIVVAVIDTGVRFEHPDLRGVASGGNLLPGYDMVSDLDVANDGDGRDADASDPGDWVTDAEVAPGGPLEGCDEDPRKSSWHGTMVAGLVAALTDNGIGMASVGRGVRVLPVRALGKCGGFDSDVVAAMRWAAGLAVPGVPANPTPARVLSLSLGHAGACSANYRNAVAEILATGAVIVASAGNDAGRPPEVPANCDGVIGVAGLRHVGTKVGFSNLGASIAVSAPGGNCVNTQAGSPCLYPILSTSNDGATTPGASTYTDSFRISVGTSFSTPLVAGTAALMLSARPSLSPAQVRSFLQGTTRPFQAGADPSIPVCTAPKFDASGNPVDQLECRCTTSTCGAGMLDAAGAVRAAQAGVQIVDVVEFYHARFDHYFLTWRPDEIAALDAGTAIRGWARTGASFRAWATPEAGSSPVCRFYIPPSLGDSHFYGRGHAECEATARDQPGLVLEDARFMHLALPTVGNCPAPTIPVYRVFSNRADANHRYTTDRAVRDQMVAKGWLAEGDGPDRVVMCAPR
jgi:serine protease